MIASEQVGFLIFKCSFCGSMFHTQKELEQHCGDQLSTPEKPFKIGDIVTLSPLQSLWGGYPEEINGEPIEFRVVSIKKPQKRGLIVSNTISGYHIELPQIPHEWAVEVEVINPISVWECGNIDLDILPPGFLLTLPSGVFELIEN